ncbi:hypothetical protein BKA61DRAFT_677962 [Leptodontidium sp. MPI-SDFR-AT-0119]|nr:hypothetical protein BKA61DRAFT_677962 [Leptodontidium sp. MPI-SDFR-AT-0119]
MATREFRPKVYIHLIRHARAQHNYDPKTATPAQKSIHRAFLNPSLTPQGRAEALDLLSRFPYMHLLTHILTSPLRRTLETTILALEPAIRNGIHPIVIEELREVGMGTTSTGTEISGVLRELGELGDLVMTDTLKPDWEFNLEQRYEADERAEKAKCMLKELGDILSGQVGGTGYGPDNEAGRLWNGYSFGTLPEGRDVHIAVVSHACFLWKMIGEKTSGNFGNAEFRTFQFRGDEGCLERGQKSTDLIETQESWGMSHPSTTKAALAERAKAREFGAPGVEVNVAEMKGDRVEHLEKVDSGLDMSLLDPELFV